MSDKVYLGHRVRRRFGQNFLTDPYVIDEIVSTINPITGENLVEIGPGLGALTKPILDKVDKLIVVELDRDLAERMRNYPEMASKLTIYEADVIKFDFRSLSTLKNPLRIFGNLPYNISTPLLFHLFTFTGAVKDMHFMMQKEMVNRLAADPGSKAYGRLTVMAQYYCKVVPVIEVSPSSFTPAPKVDSTFVRLIPHNELELPHPATNLKWLERVCREGFNQRRKTVRNCFKKMIDLETLTSLEIDPTARPENLTLAQFVLLANWMDANNLENNNKDLI
ncbi:16S rRNA (adenine(1518)-N(6)/adenine(1519)-N(6))-dimethyltransferase RsmA [Candidatus Enterovibrio escicola]|uniref:Ribosomal RNA small subunit methyltransferase A n=1 Tax=Candidatus Enterovibrio escicola TaxID=1927127 RepID=A0A2A5T1T8_9GAMM|nr:16S rRNA (adenine(1518)-N(6)/adenine(1519)-N(6))-dimethyltransferase RsmA [Candidatus Enterovibrio escacola]PCS22129.1 SSU rRNA dimethyltransferase [Candidatus Enterovibrio escacola]